MAGFVADRKISISQKKNHYFLASHRCDSAGLKIKLCYHISKYNL